MGYQLLYRLRYLMNNLFRLLAGTLNIPYYPFDKVEMNPSGDRYSKVHQWTQSFAERIYAFYDHDPRARDLNGPAKISTKRFDHILQNRCRILYLAM